ncbi:MAG: DUF456 domain-containing protein [Chryseolinea sp.]
MDILWIILGIIMLLLGLAGSIVPALPGPPLCFVGLLLQQFKSIPPFTSTFLWLWAGAVVVLVVLDYVTPIYGTKKWGGSKFGIWGSTIGWVAGMWFGPVGIFLGPFVGAFIGEVIANKSLHQAWKAALGSFIGFLVGTLLKLIACFIMTYYFIVSLL